MRRFIVAFCVLIPFVMGSGRADSASALTGKMARYNYFVGGTWKCDVNIPKIGDHPAQTTHNAETYEVAPGNILHGHTVSAVAVGDGYTGYDDKAGVYWFSSTDGAHAFGWQISKDGVTFEGYGWPRDSTDSKVGIRETHTKVSANEYAGRVLFSFTDRPEEVTKMCRR